MLAWFAACARDLPWRRTLDPYAVWVSEIMLQQTQVKTVIPYWERWMRALPAAAALAAAPEQRVLKLWEGLGYYTRARNLQNAARVLVAEHGGGFPCGFDAVLALPGVGRYTAGAICSIAFNQPAPILDGNVIRVLARVFGIRGNPHEKKTSARLWRLAEELVQAAARIPNSRFKFQNSKLVVSGSCSALNQSLMELGALVCLPAQPKCGACPVRARCVARAKNLTARIPAPKPRPPAVAKNFAAFVIERDGRFAVRRRKSGMVNGGLWEFPNIDLSAFPLTPALSIGERGNTAHSIPSALERRGESTSHISTPLSLVWNLRLESPVPLCVIRHSITRYRITVAAYRARAGRSSTPAGVRWRTLEELRRLPFTAAHGKILRALATASAGGRSAARMRAAQ